MSSNLSRFYRERYNAAIAKCNTEKHHQTALKELSDLLMEPQLPLVTHLKANVALTDCNEDWFIAVEYRLNPERTYDLIRKEVPEGDTRWPEQENEIQELRKTLDALKQNQLADNPRNPDDPGAPEDTHTSDELDAEEQQSEEDNDAAKG